MATPIQRMSCDTHRGLTPAPLSLTTPAAACAWLGSQCPLEFTQGAGRSSHSAARPSCFPKRKRGLRRGEACLQRCQHCCPSTMARTQRQLLKEQQPALDGPPPGRESQRSQLTHSQAPSTGWLVGVSSPRASVPGVGWHPSSPESTQSRSTLQVIVLSPSTGPWVEGRPSKQWAVYVPSHMCTHTHMCKQPCQPCQLSPVLLFSSVTTPHHFSRQKWYLKMEATVSLGLSSAAMPTWDLLQCKEINRQGPTWARLLGWVSTGCPPTVPPVSDTVQPKRCMAVTGEMAPGGSCLEMDPVPVPAISRTLREAEPAGAPTLQMSMLRQEEGE